jgi:hypothetical protein
MQLASAVQLGSPGRFRFIALLSHLLLLLLLRLKWGTDWRVDNRLRCSLNSPLLSNRTLLSLNYVAAAFVPPAALADAGIQDGQMAEIIV